MDGHQMTEVFHYEACGLDNIQLANGFHVKETEHGRGVSIEDIDGLHQAIARGIITSQSRMRGQEVRFLRSLLDISQKNLGRLLGQGRATVARWEERRNTPIPPAADRALRLYYGAKIDGDAVMTQLLEIMEEIDELEHRLATYELQQFKSEEGHWEPTQLAAA